MNWKRRRGRRVRKERGIWRGRGGEGRSRGDEEENEQEKEEVDGRGSRGGRQEADDEKEL